MKAPPALLSQCNFSKSVNYKRKTPSIVEYTENRHQEAKQKLEEQEKITTKPRYIPRNMHKNSTGHLTQNHCQKHKVVCFVCSGISTCRNVNTFESKKLTAPCHCHCLHRSCSKLFISVQAVCTCYSSFLNELKATKLYAFNVLSNSTFAQLNIGSNWQSMTLSIIGTANRYSAKNPFHYRQFG